MTTLSLENYGCINPVFWWLLNVNPIFQWLCIVQFIPYNLVWSKDFGTGSEGPPCSHGSKQRRRDEVSGGDCIGGGDPDKDGGGVEALLREEDPSLKGERGRLMFFLSSIDLKRRERKTLSADYRCTRWIAAQDDEDIYRLWGGATVMDGVLEVQTVRQTVQLYEKGVRRRDGRAADDTCLRTCQDE
jgi:hypothetical protein